MLTVFEFVTQHQKYVVEFGRKTIMWMVKYFKDTQYCFVHKLCLTQEFSIS